MSFKINQSFKLPSILTLLLLLCYSDFKQIAPHSVPTSSWDSFQLKLLHFLNIPQNGYFKGDHPTIPQYMFNLYKSVADVKTGLSYATKPYHSNKIRSYQHAVNNHHLHFYFNISKEELSKEDILEAEFHIYKLKPNVDHLKRLMTINLPKSHLLEIKIHQILADDDFTNPNSNRKLLDSRRMSLNSIGWEVFYVKDAITDWVYEGKQNLGLEITVQSIFHEDIKPYLWRWAKGRNNLINKRPVLIIYSNSKAKRGDHATNKLEKEHDYGFHDLLLKHHFRNKLPIAESNENKLTLSTQCRKDNFVIDFEKLGWSNWMIYPLRINSLTCSGECGDLDKLKVNTTNVKQIENFVSEIVHYSSKASLVCVPNHLASIDILYVDESCDVTLSQVDQVVVRDCSCQ